MRYRKALQGILFMIIVASSIFMGMAFLSNSTRDNKVLGDQYLETMPVTSDDPSVPQWNEINHTKLAIDTEETPEPSVMEVNGVSVPIATFNKTFINATSINATNMQTSMNLSYSNKYTITCTDAAAASNFTVRLYAPLVSATQNITTGYFVSNADTIRIKWSNGTCTFPLDYSHVNSEPIYNVVYPNVTEFVSSHHFFRFNISNAAMLLHNVSLATGETFLFEVNYTVQITFTSWVAGMKTTEKFRIEGDRTTLITNYTVSFRVSGPKGVNITFHYIPVDRNYTSSHQFYVNNVLMAPQPSYKTNIKGWTISASGGGLLKLNTTGIPIKVEFTSSATIGFIEQMAGKWNSDGMATSMDTRTRKYKLAVLSGPSVLLIERVEFTANDLAYATVSQSSRYITPSSPVTITDDTYKYYDPVLEQEVTKSNGTKFSIDRVQRTSGPITLSFNYKANYNATLRILDELRNPLPGAEVILYFHGIRFGSLMSVNGSNLQPVKLANSLGVVTFNFLPEGNYSVEVHFQNWVKTQDFSIYGGANSVSIDVITDVPYQPWILVAWIAIFAMLCALGIALFKRKK